MWLVTSRWFSPSTPVFSTNKTDRQDIIEILLKVVLNTINHIPDLNIEIKGNYVIVMNYIIVAL